MSLICKSFKLFRPLFNSSIRTFRMSANLREEALESLKSNPYFDKYSQKILQKQKVSPEEFFTKLENNEKSKRKMAIADKKFEPLNPGVAKGKTSSQLAKNSLDKVMKLDLIKDKDRDEIKQIWEEFHKSKECSISATVPADKFTSIIEKSKKHPIFLLPLPRDQGYEFIMLQFGENEVHFTPLISYQTHKENAPECLTILYFPEFAEEKNIVLMKGDYDKKIINVMEAQCLANQLQLYYGENDAKRDRLMERFTFSPDEFKHMDLIAEIETISF